MNVRFLSYLVLGALPWLPIDKAFAAVPPEPPTQDWIHQFGGSEWEATYGLAVDRLGSVYATGGLGGVSFLRKYHADGTILWSQQFGNVSVIDESFGVSVDNLGGIYVTGHTFGSVQGANQGGMDAYVSKFDADGNPQWSSQIGSFQWDRGWGIAADGLGNVYVSGSTDGNLGGTPNSNSDAFLVKYDAAGNRLWTRQFGTSQHDNGRGVATDNNGNVYVTGSTVGNLDGTNAGLLDVFVRKYDPMGAVLWTKRLGTTHDDHAAAIAVDTLGSVYISGNTYGNLNGPNAGRSDAFVTKYDISGNLLWTRQFGTAGEDESWSLSADSLGNVFVTGFTSGALEGTNSGGRDVFLRKYDADGVPLWIEQIGTPRWDEGIAVSADRLGGIYIGGYTEGNLAAPRGGGQDGFIARYSEQTVPEPPSALIALSLYAVAATRWRVR